MKDLLTTRELAEFLRLNEKKIYQLVRTGNVPHVRIAGKWLFPREHLARWIDEQVQGVRDIKVIGSDDMLMVRLISQYSRDHLPESCAFYSTVGSTRGIEALADRKSQACCIHLLDRESGDYNIPFVRRYLSDQPCVVINLWHRTQGLFVKKGNPLGVKSIDDIAGGGLRFINRNRGSGTRLLLEYFLSMKSIEEGDIRGFANEVDTHLESALKVFFDEADVGMGIEYVTHLVPIDFIPLKEERFDLVVPGELWSTSVMRGFIEYIEPLRISKISDNLPGYIFRDTGRVIFEGS